MRTNLVRGSECLRPAARGVVRRAARSALRRRTEAGSATTRTNLVCGSECLRAPAGRGGVVQRAAGRSQCPSPADGEVGSATTRTKLVRVVSGPPASGLVGECLPPPRALR